MMKVKEINAVKADKQGYRYVNHVKIATAAGFLKVARAMMSQGFL